MPISLVWQDYRTEVAEESYWAAHLLRIEILLDAVLDTIRCQMLTRAKRNIEDTLLTVFRAYKDICMVRETYTAKIISRKSVYGREIKR